MIMLEVWPSKCCRRCLHSWKIESARFLIFISVSHQHGESKSNTRVGANKNSTHTHEMLASNHTHIQTHMSMYYITWYEIVFSSLGISRLCTSLKTPVQHVFVMTDLYHNEFSAIFLSYAFSRILPLCLAHTVPSDCRSTCRFPHEGR